MTELNLSPKQAHRFWSLVDASMPDACWPWLGAILQRGGYGQVSFNYQKYRAHRVAYSLVKGSLNKNQVVMHTCDNPVCCNPRHLIAGSQCENMADMTAKGRRIRVLDDTAITQICAAPVGSHKKLATRYGVSVSQIFRVRRRNTHV